MTNCDKCQQTMVELQPWDFKLDVCLNHTPPHFTRQNWCDTAHTEDRPLKDFERVRIWDRVNALQKRLAVALTVEEVWSIVQSFMFGGWNPEIDERITKVKGEHL